MRGTDVDNLWANVRRTWSARPTARAAPPPEAGSETPTPPPPAAGGRPPAEPTPGTASSARTSLNGYSPDVVVHHDKVGIITEQYRAIRTQIIARGRLRKLQSHLLTSATPEEGKSLTSVNLGMAFAELKSQRTLMLEADLRRPAFHRLLRRRSETGLLQLLRGEAASLEEAIQPTAYENLQFIPAGGRDLVESTRLLSGPRMGELLDALRSRYDHVLVDSPSVMAVSDACVVGALCDETLLVLRLGRTPVEVAEAAKQVLRACGCEPAGVILTHL